MLLGRLFGAAGPVSRMRGAQLGGVIVKSDVGFFSVWTLMALRVAGVFFALIAARALWGRELTGQGGRQS